MSIAPRELLASLHDAAGVTTGKVARLWVAHVHTCALKRSNFFLFLCDENIAEHRQHNYSYYYQQCIDTSLLHSFMDLVGSVSSTR